ncbi:hypothetical protein GDO81_025107, partial [Engystomops pustulosus]
GQGTMDLTLNPKSTILGFFLFTFLVFCDAEGPPFLVWSGAEHKISIPEVVTIENGSVKNLTLSISAPLNETVLFTFNITYSSKNTTIVRLPSE